MECININKNEIECNMTMLEMMAEIDRLRRERDYYKDNYELLHNKVINEECINFDENGELIRNLSLEDLELTENFLNDTNKQDLDYDSDELANAYAKMSLR
jgi:hypothetical protein